MMDELEQLEIYSNEIAPLEEMVSKLEAENNQLLAELERIKQVVEKIHRATEYRRFVSMGDDGRPVPESEQIIAELRWRRRKFATFHRLTGDVLE